MFYLLSMSNDRPITDGNCPSSYKRQISENNFSIIICFNHSNIRLTCMLFVLQHQDLWLMWMLLSDKTVCESSWSIALHGITDGRLFQKLSGARGGYNRGMDTTGGGKISGWFTCSRSWKAAAGRTKFKPNWRWEKLEKQRAIQITQQEVRLK